MNAIEQFRSTMSGMLAHAGIWEGQYVHVDRDARIIDRHHAQVECEFPDSGPYAYIQRNTFTWADGRVAQYTLPGTFKDGRLWWDTETFQGSAWETEDGIILLNLTRKDEPGAMFFEMIALGATGEHRSRTWHWFKDGQLYKRTLCDERKVLV